MSQCASEKTKARYWIVILSEEMYMRWSRQADLEQTDFDAEKMLLKNDVIS